MTTLIDGKQISANVVSFISNPNFNESDLTLHRVWLNKANNTFLMRDLNTERVPLPNRSHFVDLSKVDQEKLANFKYDIVNLVSRYDFETDVALSAHDYFAIKTLKDDYFGAVCDIPALFVENDDGDFVFSMGRNFTSYDVVISSDKKRIWIAVDGQLEIAFDYLSPQFAIDLLVAYGMI